ncbi:MAG TPA: histidine phosphatase family protein, partial [Burkholderiales bacterium]
GRTRETAEPIGVATRLPVVHDKALRERNYGAFEGRNFTEIEVEFPVEFGKFRTRDPHYAPPGGESAAQFRDRVITALQGIAARAVGRRVAVITHGGVLGVLYRQAMNIPLEAKRSYSLANASLNHFRFADGRWLLDAWGDVSHLPAESFDEL